EEALGLESEVLVHPADPTGAVSPPARLSSAGPEQAIRRGGWMDIKGKRLRLPFSAVGRGGRGEVGGTSGGGGPASCSPACWVSNAGSTCWGTPRTRVTRPSASACS